MFACVRQSGFVVILVGMFAALGCGNSADDPGNGDKVVWFVDGDSYSYGEVQGGSTATHGFEIRTASAASVQNEGLSVTPPGPGYFEIVDTNCGAVISDRCTVDVEFTPPQQGGYSTSLLLDYGHDGQSKKVLIVMTGEGT